MSAIRSCRATLYIPLSGVKCSKRNHSVEVTSSKSSPGYRDVAVYPEILDLSPEGTKARAHQLEVDALKKIETVEEKIFKVNMPKYYGWKCVMMDGNTTPLGCLPYIQHITRTHLVKSSKLPDSYLPYDSAASYMAKQIRPLIEEAIKFEFQDVRRKFDFSNDLKTDPEVQEDGMRSRAIIEKINRIIVNHLSASIPHILDSQLDIAPRHESFWFAGGFLPQKSIESMKKMKDGIKMLDLAIQYIGKPALTLRSSLPLEPLIPYSDASNESLHVPYYKLSPSAVGFFNQYRHGANIPGFWPGDSHEFGLLSYHTREKLKVVPNAYPSDFIDKSLDAQGILNSFGWLMAQACYQGFSTFNDVTYPLVTQTIVTNGQEWSLFAYQLNTVLTNHDHYKTNKLRNICYSTGPMKLFESIDENGKLIGFNDDVLKILLQYYINVPTERTDTIMKPFLGKDVKYIADIEDDAKRNWLETSYKHLMANRPRHRLRDEIYHWEWIYKVLFKSRLGDNTRRYFVTPEGKSPHLKRLDEHTPKYIPKALRVEGFKKLVMWEKTYYP